MNLGGGTHHAGRAFARGYCLFNDVAVALARLRAEGRARRALVVDCDVHQGDGTADLLAPTRASRCRCTAPATTRSSASRRTSTSTSRAAPATSATSRRSPPRSTTRSRPRRRAGVLPRRRRPVGGRPPRPPGADQGRAAGARRARARPAARRRRRGVRRAGRRICAGCPRHRRHQRRDRRRGGRLKSQRPGGVVITGARGLCKAEVGVRFPSPPSPTGDFPDAACGRMGDAGAMTRFLFAAMPAAGHVGPLVRVASELIARGHPVAPVHGRRLPGEGGGHRRDVPSDVHAPDRDPGSGPSSPTGRS